MAGFFSNISRSFKKSNKKSKKLRELQVAMAPDPLLDDADFMEGLKRGVNKREKALEDYLTLCESDEEVAKLMKQYDLQRENLEEIYWELSINGLGQWVRGHYAALSTIAYVEPLQFFIESELRGDSIREIASTLLRYWKGEIPIGDLSKLK